MRESIPPLQDFGISYEVTIVSAHRTPARLVAYDHASGLGLLRPTRTLEGVTPMSLGSAADVSNRDSVMLLPFGGRDGATVSTVVSKRRFTASWEYMLESALYVAPPTLRWAGAAMVDRQGRLVGIGSLLLRSVSQQGQLPGNLFVPVDVIKPILPDLIAQGRRKEEDRPWLGLGTEEVQGHLFVTTISTGGPADKAGIKQGDIVVSVGSDGVTTQEAFYRKLWTSGSAGARIALRVLQGAELRTITVDSIARERYFTSDTSDTRK